MIKIVVIILIFASMAVTGCGNGSGKMKETNGNELSISALCESRYLEAAARKYEELNDGVKININVFATDLERDLAKYSQIINTALMSGKGDDIIDISNLAWVKLADKNKLLDLSDEIELSNGDYYKNVMDSYLYNGGRYAIPLCFAFEAFRFNEEVINNTSGNDVTLDDLIALSREYPDNVLFNGDGFGMSGLTLAYKLFGMNFNDFIDVKNKEAAVENEKFIRMLNAVGSLKKNLSAKEIDDIALIQQYLLYTPVMCHAGTVDYTDMFLLTGANTGSSFMTIGFLPAVNANAGANKKLAVDFVKFLLSNEMQASTELLFCPVNRKAMIEMAALALVDVQEGGWAPGFDDSSLSNNISVFSELAERLTVVEYSDYTVTAFIREEMERYFKDEVTAEQAAAYLQSKLNTYLKE